MTTPIPRIQRIMVYGTCALALSVIGGVANAHTCMKKPYAQGYMIPMHPHHMQGHSGPVKPYGNPARAYDKPPYQKELGEDAEQTQRQQGTRTSSHPASSHTHEADIVETATAAGNFNTLIKAVVAADLYDTLREEGPFTLFAPTDTAFAELPDGMLDELLADQDMLVAVLSYHVVPGRLTAADLLQQRELKTLQGQILSINDLNVVSADIETANGIVHVIDNVVVPSL